MVVDDVSALLIAGAAMVSAIGSVIGVLVSWRNNLKIAANSLVTRQLEQQTNHLKDELVSAVQKLALANGKTLGHAEAELASEAFIRGRKQGIAEAHIEPEDK